MAAPTVTSCGERYALRPGVYQADQGGAGVRLLAWPHAESVGRLDTGQRAVLRALAEQPRTRAELDGVAAEHGSSPVGVGILLDQLHRGGWLAITVTWAGRNLYTVVPLRRPPSPQDVPEAAPHLSRFAVLRRDQHGVLIESALAWCDLRIHDPGLLPAIAAGQPADLPAEVVHRIWRDLRWTGMAGCDDAERTQLRSRQWSPHELWFHERSRLGYRGYLGNGFGGTFWARGTFAPEPARPTPFPGPPVPLARPDLDTLRRTDPSLTTVLEERRSLRTHDDERPLTVDQLGEFLYRCARTRLVREVDGVEYTSRPYPSGGSVYELELYPVLHNVRGLEPGMYHYDSHEHVLRLVSELREPAVRRLLRVATHGSAVGATPQVLITVAARVGRVMWKYEQMAYALILKHVGVLYQTMYCVATAMGLAGCGLGGGDAVAFTQATGLDPLVECSVGEFLLGSRPAEESTREAG